MLFSSVATRKQQEEDVSTIAHSNHIFLKKCDRRLIKEDAWTNDSLIFFFNNAQNQQKCLKLLCARCE